MFKKIVEVLCDFLMAVVLSFSMALAVPRAFGTKLVVIRTGSMAPALEVGSLCYVTREEKVREGDIITFYLDEDTVVTHRVVSVESDGTYVTKGDQNEAVDMNRVSQEDVIGTVRLHIPWLGYFVQWVSSVAGKIGMILLFLSAAFLSFALSDYKEGNRPSKDRDRNRRKQRGEDKKYEKENR